MRIEAERLCEEPTDSRAPADGSPSSEPATVLVDLVLRGVDVRDLVWRSHPHQAHLSEQEPFNWWQRPWAHPIYRLAVDPDGRPMRLRRRREF